MSSIFGFPNASRRSTDINDIGVGYYGIHSRNTSTHTGRSDIAGLPVFKLTKVEGLSPGAVHASEQQRKKH
jgi:hypothetical protein